MTKFRVTLQLDVEVDDEYVDDPKDTMRFINDEISMGLYEGAKKLEDNDIGEGSNYCYSVEHLEDAS